MTRRLPPPDPRNRLLTTTTTDPIDAELAEILLIERDGQ